jgi:hypothetical protein
MQANEFERKVQQTMDEFRLRPSDDVWQNVERRIRERKRKRRIIFFVLCSFIGLALLGYGVYNFSIKQKTFQNENITSEKINNPKTNTVKEPAIPMRKSTPGDISGKEQKLVNRNQNRSEFAITSRKNSRSAKAASGSQRAYTIKKPSTGINHKKSEKQPNPDTTNSIARNENISANKIQVLTNELNQKVITDSTKKDVSINNLVDTGSIKKIAEEEKITKKEKTRNRYSRKISWGINFSAGSSVITEDIFSFKNSSPQADLSFNSPATYPAGGGITRYPPSANKPVFAFKAGVVINKEISVRSKIAVGLQYAYLGDRIKVATAQIQTGTQQSNSSSSLFSYYRAIPQKAHTDHFHFIELPLTYGWRINRNDNHFISLNAGTSIGYMFSTNALTYDTSFGGIYFHDKSLFAKQHFNLVSGISYHFATAKKFEWSIGPQFSFDLSRIIKSDLDRRKYFLYGGIDSRIFFEKKKRR